MMIKTSLIAHILQDLHELRQVELLRNRREINNVREEYLQYSEYHWIDDPGFGSGLLILRFGSGLTIRDLDRD